VDGSSRNDRTAGSRPQLSFDASTSASEWPVYLATILTGWL